LTFHLKNTSFKRVLLNSLSAFQVIEAVWTYCYGVNSYSNKLANLSRALHVYVTLTFRPQNWSESDTIYSRPSRQFWAVYTGQKDRQWDRCSP